MNLWLYVVGFPVFQTEVVMNLWLYVVGFPDRGCGEPVVVLSQ